MEEDNLNYTTFRRTLNTDRSYHPLNEGFKTVKQVKDS